MNKKIAVIAGAGPAGLTAATEFLQSTDIKPIVIEKDNIIGGISRTVDFKGNRIDIGGHRFFSKSKWVNEFWEKFLPIQTIDGEKSSKAETEKDIMLLRSRLSRIFYNKRFFDYPVTLSIATLQKMGVMNTFKIGVGFLNSKIKKKKESNLENFYINRFGRHLYSMFFESYTEKVWGIHPSKLGADWGSQRVKGLSITGVLKDMLKKALGIKGKNVETSLIEEFKYPKYGPGQLWEKVADYIDHKGGEVERENEVTEIHVNKDTKVDYVIAKGKNGEEHRIDCDFFLSSIPIKELIEKISGIQVPEEVKRIAYELRYRDFITVGLLVKDLKIKEGNSAGRIKDNWIYIQDNSVKMGRIQIFNNWSPYMVKNEDNTVWIGLEYFCDEGDRLWEMSDTAFIDFAVEELVKLGFIDKKDLIDAVRIKMKKAYPTYYGSYYELDKVIKFLDSISNLYCIGRNGQHRYNNMDHSMLSAKEAVGCIRVNSLSKASVWNVNTEKTYHETQ